MLPPRKMRFRKDQSERDWTWRGVAPVPGLMMTSPAASLVNLPVGSPKMTFGLFVWPLRVPRDEVMRSPSL